MISKKDYTWQKDARKITSENMKSNNHAIIPINATVGSGKTRVAFNAFEDFINEHSNDKTFQMFVCPRINLTRQQKEDCIEYFEELNINVDIKEFDCESNDSVSRDFPDMNVPYFSEARHIIYFVCDKSLWDEPYRRNYWDTVFKNNNKFKRLHGWLALDEYHNYEKNQKYIYGKEIVDDNN